MKELYCEKSYRGGKLCSECYYKDSTKQKLHREDGPANIEYYINGKIEREEYYKEGVLHREDGPARIWYREDGSKEFEEYFKNGERHRIDGPTITRYYENGNKLYEVYYINGRQHRKNGPARIEYYKNGNIEYVAYIKHDLYHREDGHARIWYDEDGYEKRVENYIDGEKCDAEYIKNSIEENKQNVICDKSCDRNINDFIGRTVRHFKGNEYLVLCTALNTESDEIMVIYKALYGENITYARPLKMFMEEVPANKENLTGQKYRFQLAYL